MKVGATLLLCNSSNDLIYSMLLYYQNIIDVMSCTIHNPSSDLLGKVEVLKKLYKKFIVHIYTGEMNVNKQTDIVNQCVKKDLYDCDWAFLLDDDEFYIFNDNMIESLESWDKNGVNQVYTDGYCFYSTELDDDIEEASLKMLYRDDFEDYQYRKPIIKPRFFERTTNGNHFVYYTIPIKQTRCNKIKIYHYTFRRKQNIIIGRITESNLNYNNIKEKGLVFDVVLRDKLIVIMRDFIQRGYINI